MPFLDQPMDSLSAYHILPILLPAHVDRTNVINALKQKRIQSSIHYPPFWDFSAYKGQFSPKQAPIVAQICEKQLTLPLFPTMTRAEVDKVTRALLQALEQNL
jgi:dTDP-4-amino-4,6-dideoxygalactose transaminase